MTKNLRINTHVGIGILEANPFFVFEKKTQDYFVPEFRNKLCLIGGNWTSKKDKTPKDTLLREMKEEGIKTKKHIKKIMPFREYEIRALSCSYPIIFRASVFVVKCDPTLVDDIINKKVKSVEGVFCHSSIDGLVNESFCWGYEQIMNDYFKKVGIGIILPKSCVSVQYLSDHPNLSYEQRDLTQYRTNPYSQKGGKQSVRKE